jgi:phosphatidylserine/phosphatidylglycerophosphate/cardiolipin synthase-like enzyme
MNDIHGSTASLVITAPEPYARGLAYAARARITIGALTQLFAEARESVVIAAPFVQSEAIFEIGVLSNALRESLDRGVVVDIMSTKENLALSTFQELVEKWPQGVRLFYPSFPSSDISSIGSHAKFCIRDSEAAYVGSANLTLPALGGLKLSGRARRQHFEMGLLVSGEIAFQLRQFWNYSVGVGIFDRWKSK